MTKQEQDKVFRNLVKSANHQGAIGNKENFQTDLIIALAFDQRCNVDRENES